MIIHVYGENKPAVRGFNSKGEYQQYKNANYSGHRIAETMVEAQQYLQEYMSRGWDVKIEVEQC